MVVRDENRCIKCGAFKVENASCKKCLSKEQQTEDFSNAISFILNEKEYKSLLSRVQEKAYGIGEEASHNKKRALTYAVVGVVLLLIYFFCCRF